MNLQAGPGVKCLWRELDEVSEATGVFGAVVFGFRSVELATGMQYALILQAVHREGIPVVALASLTNPGRLLSR